MIYGRFEIKTEIWSLRDHLKSFEFLELLCLVKVTKTHTQSGLQSSFLSNGLHFPSLARTFCLRHFSLYLYFLTPIFIATDIISTSFNFDPDLTNFSSPVLHHPLFWLYSPNFSILPLPKCLSSPTPPPWAYSLPLGCLPWSLNLYNFITPSGKPESLHLSHINCLSVSCPRLCPPSEQELCYLLLPSQCLKSVP